jgi:hypothetical protein
MKRAVLYTRVSTDAQQKEGTIESQCWSSRGKSPGRYAEQMAVALKAHFAECFCYRVLFEFLGWGRHLALQNRVRYSITELSAPAGHTSREGHVRR